jgi:hypothetical protein
MEQLLDGTIMRQISSSITFEIAPGEMLPMMVAHSTRLSVHGAPVWVTRSNDVEDYWLAPGQSLRLRPGERLWLSTEGGGSARVAFVAPLSRASRLADVSRALSEWWGARRSGWRTV